MALLALTTTVHAADIGEGVCAALCTCNDWGTCNGGGNSGNSGWQWVDPAKLHPKEELLRQWQEFHAKKAARTAAQREFRGNMRNLRRRARNLLKYKSKGKVFAPKGKPFDPPVGSMLFGTVSNPGAEKISLSGIELARPVSVQSSGETTHFSIEGLRKFSAILEYSSESATDEDLLYFLNEGAAHMSGHASRISVQLPYGSKEPEESQRTVESFQAAWGMIKKRQREIQRSEDKRMNWAKEGAQIEADINTLDGKIHRASGKKRERLESKRKELITKADILRKKSKAAKNIELEQTAAINAEKVIFNISIEKKPAKKPINSSESDGKVRQ